MFPLIRAATITLSIVGFDPQSAMGANDVAAVENVQWVNRPPPESIGQFSPKFAAMIGVEGLVTLRCEALFEGTPQNCKAIYVQPAGMGFEAAAKLISATATIRPRMINGEPQAASFVFSTRFPVTSIPDVPEETYFGPEPSARALEMANSVLDIFPSVSVEERWAEMIEQLAGDRQLIVRAWLEELFPVDLQAERRINAMALARVASEAELDAFLLRGEPIPPPQPGDLEAAMGPEDIRSLEALQTLRSRYCARWSCEIEQD